MKILFIIAFKNFRDEEYFVPKEILESSGAEIKTASNKSGIALGADGGEVRVDFLVSEVNPADFDAVVFVGGPGCIKNLDNNDSYDMVRGAVLQNKILAAICVSPVILARAGALKEKKATTWSSPMDRRGIEILRENGAIYENKPVVLDGKIITANGPAAAEEFGRAIATLLTRE